MTEQQQHPHGGFVDSRVFVLLEDVMCMEYVSDARQLTHFNAFLHPCASVPAGEAEIGRALPSAPFATRSDFLMGAGYPLEYPDCDAIDCCEYYQLNDGDNSDDDDADVESLAGWYAAEWLPKAEENTPRPDTIHSYAKPDKTGNANVDYNAVIDARAKSAGMDLIIESLSNARDARPEHNITECDAVFDSYAKPDNMGNAVVDYNAVIDAHAKSGDMDLSFVSFSKALDAKLEQCIAEYDAFFDSYAKPDNMGNAVVDYNAVIDAVDARAKSGDMDLSFVSFSKALDAKLEHYITKYDAFFDSYAKPDNMGNATVDYNAVIDARAKSGDLDLSIESFSKARETKREHIITENDAVFDSYAKPDNMGNATVDYNAVIDALAKSAGTDITEYDAFFDSYAKPDNMGNAVVDYNAVIDARAKSGDMDMSFDSFSDSYAKPIDNGNAEVDYNAAINGNAKASDTGKAVRKRRRPRRR